MKYAFFAAVALVVISSSACGGASDAVTTPSSPDRALTFNTLQVAPARVVCTGAGPQLCLQVRESSSDPWGLFYGTIIGFDYEPGYLYEIRVMEEKVANPPADGSSVSVTLVNIMSKTPVSVFPPLTGTSWKLSSLDNRPALAGVRVTLTFTASNRVSGSAGCNAYSGSATVDGGQMKIGPLVSTLRACTEPGVMAQEQAFLATLEKATVYRLASGELQIGPNAGVVSAVFIE